MSSESLQEAVARNSNWINSVITNSKLSSQLTELLSITSLDQKVIIQEGALDAKYANAKTLRGYKGDWEADTNNPVLSNSSGVIGDIYKVSIGGNIDIGSGSVNYVAGDLIYLSENNWIKISPNQISDIAGLQLALDSLAGALIPQGNWNANINDPDIATGASTGQFWIVSLAGSTNVGGITDWELNDWAVKTETGWAKIDNSDKVISVAGRVGVVTLGITDISGLTTSLAEAVKLTGNQTVAGIKSFTSDFYVADKVISTGDVLSLQTGNGFGGSLILNDAADTLVSSFDLLQVKSFLTSAGMTSNFNNSALRVLATTPLNNTGLSSLSLATSDASSYGVSLNAWRFGTSGQPKFVLKMHNNSATGLDALIVDTSGNSVFAGTLAASNLIGTNTGDQNLSISGQTLTISGTGSSVTLPTQSTSNFVTLDTTQTISGTKTFSSNLSINGSLTVTQNILGADFIQMREAGTTENVPYGIGYDSVSDFPHTGNDGYVRWLNHYGIGIHRPLGANATGGRGLYMAGYFGLDFFTAGANRLHISQFGESTFYNDLTISNTNSARLVLLGDSNNTGDAGQEDAIIDFLGDAGAYGYRLNSENYSLKTAFNIQENKNGAYTSRLYIDKDGNVGIGTTSPDAKLGVVASVDYTSIKLSRWNTTGNTIHRTGIATQNYLGAEQDTAMLIGYVDSGQSVISLGGSSGIHNAATKLRFYTAANTTTLSGTERMTILNNGYVGINDDTPAYQLDVDGTIRATGNIIAYSDIRVKENVKTIDSALDKVTKLRGVEYNKIGEDSKSIGVIAQEIEKVVPEVVETDEKGMKAVAYGNISGLLIEAIKELKLEIEELKGNKCKCNI
tara:strand:+ start:3031 stop:5583 length:2553 start_codon:yes stop_codon:yes gene_type:complete